MDCRTIKIELKRYAATRGTGNRLVNLYRKSDLSEKRHILVISGRNIKNRSNTQLEHRHLMKGTIVNVTIVIKITTVMDVNNLLI